MTIIVYDNKSLITDSLGYYVFQETGRLSYFTNKIYYNSSKTVAMAYCGDTLDAEGSRTLMRHAEVQLIISEVLYLRQTNQELPKIDPEPFIVELLGILDEKINKDSSGIAISRNSAVQFDKGVFTDISSSVYNGVGCYCDSYWLFRNEGNSINDSISQIADNGELVGGPINVCTQAELKLVDVADFIRQLTSQGKYKNIAKRDISAKAKPTPRKR